MKINLLINGGLYDSQAGYSAVQFCDAAVTSGHRITQVFFYQQGVTQGSALAEPLSDEFHASSSWAEISHNHDIPLVVCVAAGERRGIINPEQQLELGKNTYNLHPAFTIAGLASFHEACISADRTVTFNC